MVHYINLKGIKEVFNDYKETSLLLATCKCDFKCEKEGLCPIGSCQNSELIKSKTIKISNEKVIDIFKDNPLVTTILIAGLEPFLQFEEIYNFIKDFRKNNNNTIVIFTGYYPNEIQDYILKLKEFFNIIIKFGRFIENSKSRYDDILGVVLASENQYAKRIEDL